MLVWVQSSILRSTYHLRHPIQRTIERASPNVESQPIDIVLLIRVKHIGRKPQWKHEENTPISNGLEGDNGDVLPAVVHIVLFSAAKLSESDSFGGAEEDSKNPAEEHDDH